MTEAVRPIDKRQLRDALGAFTTGVTVVTTRSGSGKLHGVTVNSFTSVSLDPPLVLWSQACGSKSFDAFMDADAFAVNILAEDQVTVSDHFAKSGDDKFAEIEHELGKLGLPLIPGCVAHLECTKVATYPGGDHVIYIGRVERITRSPGQPLVFLGGRYVLPPQVAALA